GEMGAGSVYRAGKRLAQLEGRVFRPHKVRVLRKRDIYRRFGVAAAREVGGYKQDFAIRRSAVRAAVLRDDSDADWMFIQAAAQVAAGTELHAAGNVSRKFWVLILRNRNDPCTIAQKTDVAQGMIANLKAINHHAVGYATDHDLRELFAAVV